jgi:heptosyltransferase-2
LIGNDKEEMLCDDIIEKIDQKANVTNFAGKTSIQQLFYLLSKVDLTITNCNGISHLACTANSPLIGLYGPTDYRVTGPISKNFVPITAGLDCSPCFRRDYRFGCGDPVCMEKISVDKVYQNIRKYL